VVSGVSAQRIGVSSPFFHFLSIFSDFAKECACEKNVLKPPIFKLKLSQYKWTALV
jgi:hypothetical protein